MTATKNAAETPIAEGPGASDGRSSRQRAAAAQSVPGDTRNEAPAARISFSADRELLQELARAKELLRHKFPGGELGPLLKEALKALLDKVDLERQRAARKRTVLPGRRIPKWVRRAVSKRDGGRCAFTAADGRRCQERSWLEYDHVVPFAHGGRSDDPANIRLLCRAHNQQVARAIFGERAGRASSAAPPN